MCPGRPRCRRRVERIPEITYFKPRGIPITQLEMVVLSVEELESVRLVDLEGMEHEPAAEKVGISRRAFWDDLQSGRKKIIDALVNGKAIEIKGGHFVLEGRRKFRCLDCDHEWVEPSGTRRPLECPECDSANIRGNPEGCGCRRKDAGVRGRCSRVAGNRNRVDL
jgi:predicted DNA-binding protein (UPF0251 family)